jgi:ATP-dependent DNA helicase PIF1
MSLSEEQQYLFDEYKSGSNLFITGPGGCGKSFLIKHIVDHAKESKKQVDVCALTGCAAFLLQCGATTLHRWSQLGLAKGTQEDMVKYIYFNKRRCSKWKKTQLLIVDEVSMMSKHLFELIDKIGKTVHKNNKPFGGIQVIFCGDFYQLPPVGNDDEPETKQFCFESPQWDNTFDVQMELTEVFRQKDDSFVKMLHQIRKGKITKNTIAKLQSRIRPITEDIVKPVRLTPIKAIANRINMRELSKLNSDEFDFSSKVYDELGPFERTAQGLKPPTKTAMDQETKFIMDNSLFENQLKLKIGCQVMCIANIDVENGITNGSTGVVREVHNNIPIVQFHNGLTLPIAPFKWQSEKIKGFGIQQIPLILAWAVTIHKSQGATLDCAQMDLGSNVFACGQTYVALSRVKALENLYLTDFDYTKIRVNKKVREFYQVFEE